MNPIVGFNQANDFNQVTALDLFLASGIYI